VLQHSASVVGNVLVWVVMPPGVTVAAAAVPAAEAPAAFLLAADEVTSGAVAVAPPVPPAAAAPSFTGSHVPGFTAFNSDPFDVDATPLATLEACPGRCSATVIMACSIPHPTPTAALLLLAATTGCYYWLLLLAATAGCYCWLLLLAATAGCYCWLLLLAAVGSSDVGPA
jgi:hypothetical protein